METNIKVNVSLIVPVRHGDGAVDTYLERQGVEVVKTALAEINTVSEIEIVDIAGIVRDNTGD